jgi:esterase
MLRIALALVASLFLGSCQSVTPRSWSLPPDAKALRANGYDMAYVEKGAGVPIVLVHGNLTDYRYWRTQMEPFAASHRVVAVSLRRFYPEPWNGDGDDFSLEQHSRDLSAFIKGLNAGSVHLVGHSRGGDVAILMAKANPGLLRTLTLADPAPLETLLPKTPEAAAEADARRKYANSAIERLQQKDIDGGIGIFVDGAVGPGAWQAIPESRRQAIRDNAWSIKSSLTDAQTPFSCADASAVKVPVLLVTGERSPRPYGVMHDALASCLRGSKRVVIPNASHNMNIANPQAFNTAVLAFVAKPD